MIQPNFSESQLQQLLNTEITMQLFSRTGLMFNPTIVSLIKEKDLGWDTAFYFPWLLTAPHPNHKGCNFFIQYKLSELVEGERGGEYSSWGCPYLRFEIPYHTRNRTTGTYHYDYNHFERLKELADKRYGVYYATNHVLYDHQLFNLSSSQRLADEIPFLDISAVSTRHARVTFTERSSYFLLHSEERQIQLVHWKQLLSALTAGETTSLIEDVEFMNEIIVQAEKQLESSKDKGFLHEKTGLQRVPQPLRSVAEALIVARYLRLYLNIHWYKLWTN